MERNLNKAIIFYLIVMLLIYISKPDCLFNKMDENNESLKNYGLGNGETLFSYHMLAIVLGILTFSGVIVIESLIK